MWFRPSTVSEEIEQRERLWWKRFAEVEDRFCWVQTPGIQRIIRGGYLREIIQITKPSGRILELGCGTGWLSILLAELGASEVFGVDFSEEQIRIATENAKRRNVSNHARFQCVDGTSGGFGAGQFDTVIVHAFLHHLTVTEIEKTLKSIPNMLKPDGVFIVFEPIKRISPAGAKPNPWMRRLWKLLHTANRGAKFGLRKFSEAELTVKALIGQRSVGIAPHGPSPKEMPFAEGELENYLGTHFQIMKQKTCMAASHLVLQEWLLRQLSHPISSRLLVPIVARLAARYERKAISSSLPLGDVWCFNMFVCRPR